MNTKLIVAVLWLLATTVFPSNTYADEPATARVCETPIGKMQIEISPAAKMQLVGWEIADTKAVSTTAIEESGCSIGTATNAYKIIVEEVAAKPLGKTIVFGPVPLYKPDVALSMRISVFQGDKLIGGGVGKTIFRRSLGSNDSDTKCFHDLVLNSIRDARDSAVF